MASEPGLPEGKAKDKGGRPRKALSQADLRETARRYYGSLERYKQILEMSFKLAVGQVSVLKEIKDGERIYLDIPANFDQLYKLLEYCGGKATQPIDHSGEINNPAAVEVAENTRKILEKLK